MATKKTATATATAAYLEPILAAATLLKVRPYSGTIEQLTRVLDHLAPEFPGDVLDPVHALTILRNGIAGTVEELEILDKVWPGFSGDVRYTLTATTLTWKWSSKHTGRYATITVPFPTILPMQITVDRFCDMDDLENHCDECRIAQESDEDTDCNCDSFVEQTVCATVTDWNDQTESAIGAWLERAVDGPVKPATFPAKGRVKR